MGWFRARTRLGTCLALVALALNLAFAVGHHHFDELRSGHAAAFAVDAPDHAGDEDRDHDAPAAHACPTCAVVTAAPIAAAAPAVPARVRTSGIAVAATSSFGLRDDGSTAFEARAPPRA